MVARDRQSDLAGGNRLNPVDSEIVTVFACLLARLEEVRRELEFEGVLLAAGVHPLCEEERRLSAEIRGWVRTRPDLFGQREAGKPKREKFELRSVG